MDDFTYYMSWIGGGVQGQIQDFWKGGHSNGELTLRLLRLSINAKYFSGKKGGHAPPSPLPPGAARGTRGRQADVNRGAALTGNTALRTRVYSYHSVGIASHPSCHFQPNWPLFVWLSYWSLINPKCKYTYQCFSHRWTICIIYTDSQKKTI